MAYRRGAGPASIGGPSAIGRSRVESTRAEHDVGRPAHRVGCSARHGLLASRAQCAHVEAAMSRRAIAVVVFGSALVIWSGVVRISPSFADVPVDEVHYTFGGTTSVTLDWRGTAQDVRYGLGTAYDSTTTGAAPA